ncbi:FKBP-type peptidyl-prolyl cis-trans isomerase family protein [Hibiscus syriacus]|uniref:FKBP-type peptidyl-prolyl cis-trans isomerase family protein n=1 Tax=Hibiscus syriacus TaxID=106335 RepID=A0A6A2XEZ9_HIBSY|nr:FKBP-type peptidyl-prolyl cis-trans isomerase family protein [Hibiscus syriacus]
MRSKGHSHNKFMRFIAVPLKALGKARDLYVRSLTSCASSVSYGRAAGQCSGLPRSFCLSSATSNDKDDFRELIRAASVRSLGHRDKLDMLFRQQQQPPRVRMGSKGLPKSSSVAMGRIDEENPCEFEESEAAAVDKKRDLLYPRSKSYAVTKTSPSFDSY